MKLTKLLLFLTLILPWSIFSQPKSDQIWMLGSAGSTLNWYNGLMYLDFKTEPPTATEIEQPSIDLRVTRSNICDSTGQLLFYSNGCAVQNRRHEQMENGDEINIGGYGYEIWCNNDGYLVPQSTLILPWPGKPDQYVFLHLFLDELVSNTFDYAPIIELRATTIDMTAGDSLLGAVTQKNEVVVHDTLSDGKLTACRHANGVDWWIPLAEPKNRSVLFFLLDATGVHFHHRQADVGAYIQVYDGLGQAVFSPDGNWYARVDRFSELDIFRFDRCRGLFYAPQEVNLDIPEAENWGSGVAFSPNSQYLYASANIYLYQFDMTATDLPASKVLVGAYDGFVDFYGVNFFQMQLAPNNKIYMCPTSDSRYLHVITEPDQQGVACGLAQHSVELPNLTSASLPNFPNMRLGAAPAGYCDSLLSGIGTAPLPHHTTLVVYPNPAHDHLTIILPDPIDNQLFITDIMGRVWYQSAVSGAQINIDLEIGTWPAGLYQLQVHGRDGARIFKQLSIQH